MSSMFISRRRRWIAGALAVSLIYYGVFEWNGVEYPVNDGGPCYSPNQAFYITRHQTLWQSTNVSYPAAFGTARLFDRADRLLYEKETFIDGGAGPYWSGGPRNGLTNDWVVYFQGTKEPGWSFDLSEDPGFGSPSISCYLENTE